MPNLFPEGYDEEEVTLDELQVEQPVGYKEGVYFDEELGDFYRDGRYRLGYATGIKSWEQWCINCLSTERGKYPIYGGVFGIATAEAFQTNDRKKAESILTREICESLQADPYGRTKYVSDVTFDWTSAPDALVVNSTVVGIDDVTIDITTVLEPGMR